MKKLLTAALVALTTTSAMATEWTAKVTTDEWTGYSHTNIFSDRVEPVKPLSFPYTGDTAYMYYDCDTTMFSLYTTVSNLVGGDLYDSFTGHNLKMKIDDEITNNDVIQYHGSDFFLIPPTASKPMVDADTFMIGMPVYKQGLVLWKFDMTKFDKGDCDE